jgi:hypothetical protein
LKSGIAVNCFPSTNWEKAATRYAARFRNTTTGSYFGVKETQGGIMRLGCTLRNRVLARGFFLLFALDGLAASTPFDLAPFARPCCSTDEYRLPTRFDYGHPAGVSQTPDGRWVYGLQWAEERDLSEVVANFRDGYDAGGTTLQYWFYFWPVPQPRMPNIGDPIDDPWIGSWITARTQVSCKGKSCRFTFAPLSSEENKNAPNLPGVQYRRTVKFRLLFPQDRRPDIETVQAFSGSTVKPVSVRIVLGVDSRPSGRTPAPAKFRAYNGRIRQVTTLKGGAQLDVDATDPRPPGSNDITIIEVRNGQDSFAFAPADLVKGPIYVPDFHAYITLASDHTPFTRSMVHRGARIRERLAAEPEQSIERASREIPPQDPIERAGGVLGGEWGGRLYLPLAADSSWQKFAFEWGGNVAVSKSGIKAMGRELQRLTWRGDRISWRIGTGEKPVFMRGWKDSNLTVLENYLPVAQAQWSSGTMDYKEEAVATLLSGPLSPDDPGRREETPSVLMVKIRARNHSSAPQVAHLWLGMESAEALAFEGGELTADQGRSVRAQVRLQPGRMERIEKIQDGDVERPVLHMQAAVAGGQENVTYLMIPLIPELSGEDRRQLAQLDYGVERTRVVNYWRSVISNAVAFRVPESRFNSFARAVVAHIRISATKDSKTGLFMLPAGSYLYKVYANEASFQARALDVMGQPELASKYMEPLVKLQGSTPLKGAYVGDQSAVYHGVRIDADYNYSNSEYNLDPGMVLGTLGEHYLYTRDRAWLQHVLPGMKRAAKWMIEQRQLTKVMVEGEPCPEFGLLPASQIEDNTDWGHWFAVNAYASAGMTVLAQVLAEIGDSDAAHYQREAELYREDLRAAALRAAALAPVTRLRDNTYVPYVPTQPHQRIRLFGPVRVAFYSRYPVQIPTTYKGSELREVLYGALILLDADVFGVDERLARWILDDREDNSTMSLPFGLSIHGWVEEKYWFSQGGFTFQPSLTTAVRTFLHRGEVPAAIRDLYNLFVVSLYPTVNAFTEGNYQWMHGSGPFYKVPDEARFVRDLRELLVMEHGGDLYLAPGSPRRWLRPGEEIVVNRAPTYFGPLSYSLQAFGQQIRGTINLPARNRYGHAWVNVRLPTDRKMVSVIINGRSWADFNPKTGRIGLPKTNETIRLMVNTTSR